LIESALFAPESMISGYNTDVRHGATLFHVQTEDKGLENPSIESLIYIGGRVVASKRSSYAELVQTGADRSAIAHLVDQQHRRVIAAILAGRLDARLQAIIGPVVGPNAAELETAVPLDVGSVSEPAPEALEEVTLDAIVLDYLEREEEAERLLLEMTSGGDLALGASPRVTFRTTSALTGVPIPDAALVVRLISTVRKPATLASGRTDADGRLEVHLHIPALERGSAALVVAAKSDRGDAEIKYLL
jgi:hypothetical protein